MKIVSNNMGIGDWVLGIGPNPQSPIPNPHLNDFIYKLKKIYFIIKTNYKYINKFINYKYIKIKWIEE